MRIHPHGRRRFEESSLKGLKNFEHLIYNNMYSRQLRYFKTEKGRAATARCRRKPESVERKRQYDIQNRQRRNETANLRYYYNGDPTTCVRNLYTEV